MARPTLTSSESLVLPDGRDVRMLPYDDGSVRFRLTRGYALRDRRGVPAARRR